MPERATFFNPYRWVPASKTPIERETPSYHHVFSGLAGRIDCTLQALTPFLINDGRGRFVGRKDGTPFIPATALKGMIRSLAELIGNAASAVPKTAIDAAHQSQKQAETVQGQLKLDIAARSFGYLGQGDNKGGVFAGLIHFHDASFLDDGEGNQKPPASLSFSIAGGQPKPSHAAFYPGSTFRKIYHHDPGAKTLLAPHAGIKKDQIRQVRPLPPGVRFRFSVDFENLREAELNLLLYCLALEEEVTVSLSKAALQGVSMNSVSLCGPMRHKLGYAKPQGGGSVHIKIDSLTMQTCEERQHRYRGRRRAPEPVVGKALEAELARRISTYRCRTDENIATLRGLLIYAPGDPRAGKLDYPSYQWFKGGNHSVPLRPVT